MKEVNLNNRDLYYSLFDSFSKVILKYDPCKWVGNTCIKNRGNGGINGCCGGCAHNTKVGCSIQSLGCRAFLCDRAFYNLPGSVQSKWRELNEAKELLNVELRESFTQFENRTFKARVI